MGSMPFRWLERRSRGQSATPRGHSFQMEHPFLASSQRDYASGRDQLLNGVGTPGADRLVGEID